VKEIDDGDKEEPCADEEEVSVPGVITRVPRYDEDACGDEYAEYFGQGMEEQKVVIA
jgi:hypothetical protein